MCQTHLRGSKSSWQCTMRQIWSTTVCAVWPDNEPLAAGGLHRKKNLKYDRGPLGYGWMEVTHGETRRGLRKKWINAQVRTEAESVAENNEEETREEGGETVWPSVCLGSQFAKLKPQKAGRRTKLRLAWEISPSHLIKQKNLTHSKENKWTNILNDLDAPPVSPLRVLGAPFPVTTEPKWPRLPPLASLAVHPGARPQLCAKKSLSICTRTEPCIRTDGAWRCCASAQLDTLAEHGEGEGAMVAASSVSRMARLA